MFKFLEQDKYLNQLKKMSKEDLLKEYVSIRIQGSLLCSLGNVKNKDVDRWVLCENYLVKTKHVDFDLLNNYSIAYSLLNSSKVDSDKKVTLEEDLEIIKLEILKSF